MVEPVMLRDAGQIDLGSHGLIEASAGTGKTFTIKSMVANIIARGLAGIDEVLVVTFTEKATGELRARIRASLVEELAAHSEDQPAHARLAQAINRLDEAPIFTIHGFCQQMLSRYPFESGESPNLEVVDDLAVYQPLLHRLQRGKWRELYGEGLEKLLEISNYPGSSEGFGSGWDGEVIEATKSWNPAAGDTLLPETDNVNFDTSYWQELFDNTLEELRSLLGESIDREDPANSALSTAYLQSKAILYQTRKSRHDKILMPLIEALVSDGTTDVFEFVAKADQVKDFDKHHFALLTWNPKDDDYIPAESLYPCLGELISRLEPFAGLKYMGKQFTALTVRDLKKEADREKQSRGLLSFDDMLTRLDRALDPQHNPRAGELRAILGRRFAFALVDEFQDTDRIQWRILQRIFLHPESTGKLYLIGDPKQSIYGFRGADIHTYFDARETLLGEEIGGKLYELDTNWRTLPELLEPLNRFFSGGDGADPWFMTTTGREVGYTEVITPDSRELDRPTKIYHDESGRMPLSLMNISTQMPVAFLRGALVRFISREIARLLGIGNGDRPLLTISDEEGRPRPLKASDICILIRTKSEAPLIMRYLRQQAIPFTFYKQTGLYGSDEALHLLVLMEALQRPASLPAARQALLTPFFGITAEELAELGEEITEADPYRRLCEWSELAAAGSWPRLFQAILEDSPVKTPPPERPGSSAMIAYERRLTNYRHIIQTLMDNALRRHTETGDIVDLLRNRRQRVVELDDDTDLYRLETERPAVQIMTLHASKGLEFPVLFVYGGITSGQNPSLHKFHDPSAPAGSSGLVYDLTKNHSDEHQREAEEENRRLYYVALTRAKHKLYLPQIKVSHQPGPIPTLVCKQVEEVFYGGDVENNNAALIQLDDWGGEVSATDGESPAPRLDNVPAGLEPAGGDGGLSLALPERLPHGAYYGHRALEKYSFSRLNFPTVADSEVMSLSDTPQKEEDEFNQPDEEGSRSKENLPASKFTGRAIHDILEYIDYQTVAQSAEAKDMLAHEESRQLLADTLSRYGLLTRENHAGIISAVADVVWNALQKKLPLTLHGEKFYLPPLSLLSHENRLHEVEYLHAYPRQLEGENGGCGSDGFITGYIDLVFRTSLEADGEEKYFMLDWKSNYLAGGYGQDALLREMTHPSGHRYEYQYKLYSAAMLRWLEDRFPGFDFERHFGGFFYLFLRGMDAKSDGDEGVFFYRPEARDEVLGYEEELGDILSRQPIIRHGRGQYHA